MTALSTDRMAELNHMSARHRANKALIRAGLRNGNIDLHDLLAKPPREMEDEILIDLVRLLPGVGRVKAERLGRRAVRDGINLIVPVKRSSQVTRGWLSLRLVPGPGKHGRVQYNDELPYTARRAA